MKIAPRATLLAAAALLLLAGFGCRAPVTINTNDGLTPFEREEAAWIVEPATFGYRRDADIATGRVTVTMRTKPNTDVAVTLSGPGTVENPSQRQTADGDGRVTFTWNVNRLGTFRYEGEVLVVESVAARFHGEGVAE